MASYRGSVLMKYIRDDDVNFGHIFKCQLSTVCNETGLDVILNFWKQIMHNVAVTTKEECNKGQDIKGETRWTEENDLNRQEQGEQRIARLQN